MKRRSKEGRKDRMVDWMDEFRKKGKKEGRNKAGRNEGRYG